MENTNDKKPIYKKWWFWLIIVIIVAGIIGGAAGGSKDNSSSDSEPDRPEVSQTTEENSSATSQDTEENSSTAVESIEVSAVDLLAAYEGNEIAADKKYKDQTLKITGIVDSISTDIADRPYITLADERNEFAIIGVQCYFDKENEDALAQLKEGDSVTVIGKCDGKVVNVSIKDCQLG